VSGALRTGDRPDGKEIADHFRSVAAALPAGVKTVFARADSGFYCWQAVQAYHSRDWRFIIVARKTARLVEELHAADWEDSPRTDADQQCEFRYQPEGWDRTCRFLALRYRKKPETKPTEQPEQYQLFDTPEYTYRVFVTNMDGPLDALVWFYNQRAGAETRASASRFSASLRSSPMSFSPSFSGLLR
jgi:hypothetical protein